MTDRYYAYPADVREYTGVMPDDLGFDSERELNDCLEKWLKQATSLIHEHQGMDYFDELEVIPKMVNNIAVRIVANMVAQAKVRRQSTIVRVDDMDVQGVVDRVLTDGIKVDLSVLPREGAHNRFVLL